MASERCVIEGENHYAFRELGSPYRGPLDSNRGIAVCQATSSYNSAGRRVGGDNAGITHVGQNLNSRGFEAHRRDKADKSWAPKGLTVEQTATRLRLHRKRRPWNSADAA